MENKEIMKCSIMEEVREMRRRISAEFGHDFNKLAAYYQKLDNEMQRSGKYKYAEPPSENRETENDSFTSFIPIQLEPQEFEIIETLAKSRGISPENLIREWVVERIDSADDFIT